ncbi:hypothetical protein H4582DRAFT_1403589 [Lactarius indigo]|nr:hypothetical protein H4582DRAFT_1403589 [Lactarius indigo]
MSSTSFLSSISFTTVTGIPTSTPTSDSGKKPASMTVLFGALVVFSSLFAVFLLLCFFWQYRRALRRGLVLEYDDTTETYRGVPEMWEVWTQAEPNGSQRDWGSIRVSRLRNLLLCDAFKVGPKNASRYLLTSSVHHVSIPSLLRHHHPRRTRAARSVMHFVAQRHPPKRRRRPTPRRLLL